MVTWHEVCRYTEIIWLSILVLHETPTNDNKQERLSHFTTWQNTDLGQPFNPAIKETDNLHPLGTNKCPMLDKNISINVKMPLPSPQKMPMT